MTRPGRFAVRWLGLAGILLAACASGPGPVDHFYRLEATAPETPMPNPVFPGVLEVDLFRSDALAGERLLLYRTDEASPEVRRQSYHYWVDPPPQMIQRELTGYLRAAGAATRVVTPDTRIEPDFVLRGRILRLERLLTGHAPRVLVRLEISVVSERNRALALLGSYREEQLADGTAVEASVVAFEQALTRIFERFLDDASRVQLRGG